MDNPIRSTLTELLAAAGAGDTPCMVVGGNAAIMLGVPRFTRDIDLAIPEETRLQWDGLLASQGYRLIPRQALPAVSSSATLVKSWPKSSSTHSMTENPTPDGQPSEGSDPAGPSYRGLTYPTPGAPLHHRGSGWEGVSWIEFMDDTAVQTDLFIRNQPPRERRPIKPLPSKPFTLGAR